ncbi:histone H1.10 [Narcine bancroftii]|uniref:histone H1.10 n=1 Tax=Narcine bancroftii TaxID=1343680 RepID=UPI003831A9B2
MAAEVESLPVAPDEEEEEEEEESAPKKPGSKKKKSRKGKNQPGKYSALLVEILHSLGDRNGSSLAMILKEARKIPWFDKKCGRIYMRYALRALVLNGTLNQVKGRGANGSFKLTKGESGQANKKKASGKAAKKSSKKSETRKSRSQSASSSKSKKGKASKKSKSKKR